MAAGELDLEIGLGNFPSFFYIFSIACISCPTLYERLRQSKPDNSRAIILEYDKRFAKYGDDFLFYDYNEPAHIPNALHGTFDLVVADPPFLSEECLTKTAITIRLLAKEKVLLCTGMWYPFCAFMFVSKCFRSCDERPCESPAASDRS